MIFTDSQLNNLMVFLERINLSGNEVSAYVEILQILNTLKEDNVNTEREVV